ncbi:hypothetical protein PVAG01_06385 [Phlyctema vagabunda]|uniref:Uncharacterized protein n=1 Tax=Phlyctema vagabunda TaxID=108571 RepID=A0ABR4PFZ7_9HELO
MRTDRRTKGHATGHATSSRPQEESQKESADEDNKAAFPLLSLPSELRNKIYAIAFESVPRVIDLDPDTFRILRQRLAILRVSRQVHDEVAHYFYANHTFRLFPIFPGRYFRTSKPLLARLAPRHRNSITSLELRLGPGWQSPPKGWIINDALGLKDCTSARVLRVFVECDPSDVIFEGFRAADGFYEKFSRKLLEGVLKDVPSIKVVEFDAWTSVKREGDMIAGLLEAALMRNKVIAWGPERGWDAVEHPLVSETPDFLVSHGLVTRLLNLDLLAIHASTATASG